MVTQWYTNTTLPYLDIPNEYEDEEDGKEYDEDVFKEDR